MASLHYSPKALKSLHKFHKKKFIFFVEGDDDIPFWQVLLNKHRIKEYFIKESGGKNNLSKYATFVMDYNINNIIILFDCDYSDLLKNQLIHQNIIYTYGYSIENSLYSACNVSKMICIYGRINGNFEKEYKLWLKKFVLAFYEMVIFDIINVKNNLGLNILNDNCSKYLKSNKIPEANKEAIEKELNIIRDNINENDIKIVKDIIKKANKELHFIIRGHFLTNAIMCFIKDKVRKETRRDIKILSKENFYSQLVGQFQNCIRTTKDIKILSDRIKQINNTA